MYGFAVSSLIGVCLGFMFGVGCALAVMYSIYMGGYRAALRDAGRDVKPDRWFEEQAKVDKDPEKRPG
ncbi:hypothetical protein Terro_3466 [Terriglobus roseus DSM 18391]|uniref:Uncharacterized protein n=1 Tax=Terriglobus roseus (strain DSM 18391 / NRRL B-41598 / KBS 63) TaxID=926566 RepID=I3ZKB2_TERRK|nr:hypothetical protein [Terriglobus roseus]AFL89680.1 hypothetical protein Terro_3466 [Terriglobus roseus DSM 18391]